MAKRTGSTQSASAIPRDSQSRSAILAAALKNFTRDGFSGASLHQIARMAQVAPPLIYYHFGSKDNLWRETIKYSMSDILHEARIIRNATRALDPLDRLRTLIRAFAGFAARNPDHFVMIMSEAGSGTGLFDWAQQNYSDQLLEENMAMIEEIIGNDENSQELSRKIAFVLFGGILVYFTINRVPAESEAFERKVDEFAELVFAMFRHGLVAGAGEGPVREGPMAHRKTERRP